MRTRKIVFAASIAMLFLFRSSFSQSTAKQHSLQWIRTGGPPGGLGYDIRYDFNEPDIWYATDNFAGVHKSTDNGKTWFPSNNGIPRQSGPTTDHIPVFCLTVDPHNPQILWAGTDPTMHIYKSTDGGLNWTEKDSGLVKYLEGSSFRGFTVDPTTSDIVYAAGEIPSRSWANENLVGRQFDKVRGFVYKTTDGGSFWELIWSGDDLARYVWIDPRDTDVLYVSTGIFDREAANSDPVTGFPGGIGVVKSTDGGETWNTVTNGIENLYVGSLFMHPEDPSILLAGTGNVEYNDSSGVYRTTNGGESWSHVLDTQEGSEAELISSVELSVSEPNIGYAAGSNTFYRTEDGGLTWSKTAGGLTGWGPPGVQAGWPIDLQCDPRDPGRVFANNYNGGNFLSEDGGYSWQNSSDGYTGAQMRGISVDRIDPARVYSTGRSGIWRSDDAGTTWYGIFYPPENTPILGLEWQSVVCDPSQSDHILAGHIEGSSIFESTDGGFSWQLSFSIDQISQELVPGVRNNVPVSIVYAHSDPEIVYAGLCTDGVGQMHEPRVGVPGAGVIVSTDGGTTWERAVDVNLDSLGVLDVAVDPTDAQTVYAAAETGLFKTTDSGQNWNELTGSLPDKVARAVAIKPDDSQHVLVAFEGDGVYLSTDGGGSWTAGVTGLEPNGSLHDIVFDPVHTDTVYTSDYRSGMYRSTDAGSSWEQINDGLNNRCATALTVFGEGQHLYLATNGEGVYRLDLNGPPPTGVDHFLNVPADFSLEQNFPNPFNATTTIPFSLKEKALVTIKVFSLLGKELEVLLNETKEPGEYSVKWDAGNLPSGIYIVRFQAGEHSLSRKLILNR